MQKARLQFGLGSLLWFVLGVSAIVNLLLAEGGMSILVSWLFLAVYYFGARDFVAERIHWVAAITGLGTVAIFVGVFVGVPFGSVTPRDQDIAVGLALGAMLGSCLMSYGIHLVDRLLAVVDY